MNRSTPTVRRVEPLPRHPDPGHPCKPHAYPECELLEDRVSPALVPSVFTDKLEYFAGQTAIITATGFDAGMPVLFQVLHDASTPGLPGGLGHEPWQVIDGGVGDVDNAANGSVHTSWYLSPDDSMNALFTLFATGLYRGQPVTVTATFSDPPPPKANLDQGENGPADAPLADVNWINGDLNANNSHYREGDAVPFRVVLTNLSVGAHTLLIEYDNTENTEHAYDYLTSFDVTQTLADPTLGTGITSAASLFPIPTDPSLALASPAVTPLPQAQRQMAIWNGIITNVQYVAGPAVGPTSPEGTHLQTQVLISFNVVASTAVIAWGGHLASVLDWGVGDSAGALSGAPYHMRLQELDGDHTGNQERSVHAAAIGSGIITVIKDAVPDDAQDFAFTTTSTTLTGLGSFTLDDDGDPNNGTSNQIVFTGLFPGTYTITEGATSGWTLTHIDLVESGKKDGSTDLGSRTATIELETAETATVTFTNAPVPRLGSITVTKDAVPDDARDFAFTLTGPSGFSQTFRLDDDSNPPHSNTITFSGLVPGDYKLVEDEEHGWSLTGIDITDPSQDTTGEISTRTVNIGLAAGEEVAITVTNTKLGSITVKKDAVPDNGQDFVFVITGPHDFNETFTLDDDADGTWGNTRTFAALKRGTYVITEYDVSGWALTGLVEVESGDQNSTTDLALRRATIELDKGEEVTVTFTNTKLGSIRVTKNAIPEDAQDFAFTFTDADGVRRIFSLDDDADATLASSATISGLLPGNYRLVEEGVDGWTLTDLDANDPSGDTTVDLGNRAASVALGAGEDVELTFTNTASVTPPPLPPEPPPGPPPETVPVPPTAREAGGFGLIGPSYLAGTPLPLPFLFQVPAVTWASLYGLGGRELGTISGYVFRDDNGNGLLDLGEGGLGNQRVFLEMLTGRGEYAVIAATRTTEEGEYIFDGLEEGTYRVRVVLPPELRQTTLADTEGMYLVTIVGSLHARHRDFGTLAQSIVGQLRRSDNDVLEEALYERASRDSVNRLFASWPQTVHAHESPLAHRQVFGDGAEAALAAALVVAMPPFASRRAKKRSRTGLRAPA